jgi:hypothetical protein
MCGSTTSFSRYKHLSTCRPTAVTQEKEKREQKGTKRRKICTYQNIPSDNCNLTALTDISNGEAQEKTTITAEKVHRKTQICIHAAHPAAGVLLPPAD